MFDIAPSEFLLVAFVALVVIGPKDLPKAMRFVGYWLGRARAVGRQFRSGFDEMVREAELEEMEKKWKAENERIMRDHPPAAAPFPDAPPPEQTPRLTDDRARDADDHPPVMTERPHVGDDAPVIPAPHLAGPDTAQDRPEAIEAPHVVPSHSPAPSVDKAAS